jgi:predicted nucleic acid-binding protein
VATAEGQCHGRVRLRTTAALRGVSRIGLDSSAFITHAEGGDGARVVAEVFRRISAQELRGIASVTAIPEILLIAKRDSDSTMEDGYRKLLALCETVPVSEEIAEEALNLRAYFGLKTADAFHIATALHTHCEAIMTNDDSDFNRLKD